MAISPSLFEQGKQLFEQGLLDQAKEKLLDHVRNEPSDIDAFNIIAQIFWRTRQQEPALDLVNEGLKQAPGHPGLQATLNQFQREMDEHSNPPQKSTIPVAAGLNEGVLNQSLPLFQSPQGNTEKYVSIKILSSGKTESVFQATKRYSIEGIGEGMKGLEFIVQHIFKTKLMTPLKAQPGI